MPPFGPSLAPSFEFDTYLVLDEFDKLRVFREVDETEADKDRVKKDIAGGQYNCPVRIISFNVAEGWSRDVTEDVAREMLDDAAREGETLTRAAAEFFERATGEDVPSVLLEGH